MRSGITHRWLRGSLFLTVLLVLLVCVTAQEMIPEAVEPDEVAGVISIVLGFALMMALDVAL